MKKKSTIRGFLWVILFTIISPCFVQAATLEKDTPNYKVAYYAFDCYNMIDKNGKRSGYGYEMMQGITKYLQCTFSYVGYDKSAEECVDMLRRGELDIYTAAKKTPEREKEFVFSKHPAITSTTCMNVKAGNTKVIAGDYSTYNGLKIGLLRRHTYNDKFKAFAKEKGFTCKIRYYETPTELTNALIDGEVDALVNSYIGTPEDEQTVENFGQTPYYLMARKEDQALIDKLDAAIDEMSIETPNWRMDLYNKYYGVQEDKVDLTEEEECLLSKLKKDKTVIKAVVNPDNAPYSWYEDGKNYGILVDLFKKTANKLVINYYLIPPPPLTSPPSRTISGSSAAVTSSNSRTSGCIQSARTIATRCFCPPESWRGKLSAFSFSPTRSSSSIASFFTSSLFLFCTLVGARRILFSTVRCGNSS